MALKETEWEGFFKMLTILVLQIQRVHTDAARRMKT